MAGLRRAVDDRPARQDARYRLGVHPTLPKLRRDYGPGLMPVSVRAKAKRSSCSIVKAPCGLGSGLTTSRSLTPARRTGGHAGVLLIAITDGTDAARNRDDAARHPDNTDIMLVRVWRAPKSLGPRRAATSRSVAVGNGLLEDPCRSPTPSGCPTVANRFESAADWPDAGGSERRRIFGVRGVATARSAQPWPEILHPRQPSSTSGAGIPMLDPERLKADFSGQGRPMKTRSGPGGATEQNWSSLMTTEPASVVPPAPVHPSRLADAPGGPLLWTIRLIVLRRASFGLRAMVIQWRWREAQIPTGFSRWWKSTGLRRSRWMAASTSAPACYPAPT